MFRRLLCGEEAAWRELVETYAGCVTAISRRTFGGYGYCPAQQDVEDAVARVWSNLLENDHRLIRQCIERRSVLQTLHVLARNRSIDIMRKNGRNTCQLTDYSVPIEEHPQPDTSKADIPRMRRAMEVLTERERTFVLLFFLQQKRYREIAALTGLPQNSIGPTLNRAVAKLRVAIEQDDAIGAVA